MILWRERPRISQRMKAKIFSQCARQPTSALNSVYSGSLRITSWQRVWHILVLPAQQFWLRQAVSGHSSSVLWYELKDSAWRSSWASLPHLQVSFSSLQLIFLEITMTIVGRSPTNHSDRLRLVILWPSSALWCMAYTLLLWRNVLAMKTASTCPFSSAWLACSTSYSSGQAFWFCISRELKLLNYRQRERYGLLLWYVFKNLHVNHFRAGPDFPNRRIQYLRSSVTIVGHMQCCWLRHS